MNLFNQSQSLKKHIIWSACVFSLFISCVFSLVNFIVVYAVEDSLFEHMIEEEVDYIQKHWPQFSERSAKFSMPKKNIGKLYHSVDDFPEDLYAAFQNQPYEHEYRGENGKHYHVHYFDKSNKVLVAEVSDYLIVRPFRANILGLLLFASLFIFIVALGAGYFIAKRATAPVTKLANLLRETSPEDLPTDFSKQYPPNEIGLLANTLEQAMNRITAFIQREQHFTRDTSHELRTPITIIKNALELLNNKQLNDEEKILIGRITLANNQMEQTITTLLSLAREENEAKINEPIYLLPSVEKAIIEQSPLLENKSVELALDVNASAKIACSETVLHILLTNLLGNAFQYTEQGCIYISFNNNQLTIGDTSGGIEENIQSKVTSTLVKGSKSQGFGIGLSLIKRLCEKYQLLFTLNSSEKGVTASITFE